MPLTLSFTVSWFTFRLFQRRKDVCPLGYEPVLFHCLLIIPGKLEMDKWVRFWRCMNLNLDLVNISIERISEIASDLRPGCTVSKSSASNQEWDNIAWGSSRSNIHTSTGKWSMRWKLIRSKMQLLYPKGKCRNREESPHRSDLAMEWQKWWW